MGVSEAAIRQEIFEKGACHYNYYQAPGIKQNRLGHPRSKSPFLFFPSWAVAGSVLLPCSGTTLVCLMDVRSSSTEYNSTTNTSHCLLFSYTWYLVGHPPPHNLMLSECEGGKGYYFGGPETQCSPRVL